MSENPDPQDWRSVRLQELADISPESLGVSTPPDFLFRYVDLSAVERGKINWASTQVISFRGSPSRARRIVRPGDVLFGTVRPALQSHGAIPFSRSESIVASTGFAVIRAIEGRADSRFLFHYCLSADARKAALRAEVGSNYPAVNESDVRRFRIHSPPLPEQRLIAEILDTIDDAIRKTEQIIAKLEQVKQGLLHDLLTRGIDDNGQLRDPDRHPEQFKDSELGRIPKEWEVGQLRRWLECSPKNGYSPLEAPEWTGHVMLGLGCLTTDGFVPRQLKNAPRGDNQLSGALLCSGDLLISRSNTRDLVGLVGVYQDVGHPCTYPDLMMRLTPSNQTSSAFLELTLGNGGARRQIQAAATGTSGSMLKINGDNVKRLKIIMPPRDEQERLLVSKSSYDARIAGERRFLDKLGLLKRGLMDDLLTGRVRVTKLLQEVSN